MDLLLVQSGKTQNKMERLSAMPVNRRCRRFFEKVSPHQGWRLVLESFHMFTLYKTAIIKNSTTRSGLRSLFFLFRDIP